MVHSSERGVKVKFNYPLIDKHGANKLGYEARATCLCVSFTPGWLLMLACPLEMFSAVG